MNPAYVLLFFSLIYLGQMAQRNSRQSVPEPDPIYCTNYKTCKPYFILESYRTCRYGDEMVCFDTTYESRYQPMKKPQPPLPTTSVVVSCRATGIKGGDFFIRDCTKQEMP